jgi:hypothetical protein
MKLKNLLQCMLFSGIIILSSCSKNSTPGIMGCIDQNAANYDAEATENDGTCTYLQDCAGVDGGIAAEDDCGVCHSSYVYAGMGSLTNVATITDAEGIDGTLILAGSPEDVINNPGWNASCTGYFYYADGYSTVSYGGQTARLDMASEMMSALASSTTTEDMLSGMFENSGDYFSTPALNSTSKQIKSKTAVGAETPLSTSESAYIVSLFDGWFQDYADNVAPIVGSTTMAAEGSAGMADNRELNAKGMEYDQIVAKSLIGALCLDQVVYSYLSPTKLNVDNDTRDPNEDNNATAMEHHWDEGFGYVYGKFGPKNISGDLSSDGLLGKYLNKFPDYAATVLNAFTLGREAIIAKDYVERDAQAAIIKETLSIVVASKAISYLEESAIIATDLSPSYFHALSEGYGFILSLQFTNDGNGNAYFTHSEVNTMLNTLEAGNGFWDRTAVELNDMAAQIRSVTGL